MAIKHSPGCKCCKETPPGCPTEDLRPPNCANGIGIVEERTTDSTGKIKIEEGSTSPVKEEEEQYAKVNLYWKDPDEQDLWRVGCKYVAVDARSFEIEMGTGSPIPDVDTEVTWEIYIAIPDEDTRPAGCCDEWLEDWGEPLKLTCDDKLPAMEFTEVVNRKTTDGSYIVEIEVLLAGVEEVDADGVITDQRPSLDARWSDGYTSVEIREPDVASPYNYEIVVDGEGACVKLGQLINIYRPFTIKFWHSTWYTLDEEGNEQIDPEDRLKIDRRIMQIELYQYDRLIHTTCRQYPLASQPEKPVEANIKLEAGTEPVEHGKIWFQDSVVENGCPRADCTNSLGGCPERFVSLLPDTWEPGDPLPDPWFYYERKDEYKIVTGVTHTISGFQNFEMGYETWQKFPPPPTGPGGYCRVVHDTGVEWADANGTYVSKLSYLDRNIGGTPIWYEVDNADEILEWATTERNCQVQWPDLVITAPGIAEQVVPSTDYNPYSDLWWPTPETIYGPDPDPCDSPLNCMRRWWYREVFWDALDGGPGCSTLYPDFRDEWYDAQLFDKWEPREQRIGYCQPGFIFGASQFNNDFFQDADCSPNGLIPRRLFHGCDPIEDCLLYFSPQWGWCYCRNRIDSGSGLASCTVEPRGYKPASECPDTCSSCDPCLGEWAPGTPGIGESKADITRYVSTGGYFNTETEWQAGN